jgi:hypothetical protein
MQCPVNALLLMLVAFSRMKILVEVWAEVYRHSYVPLTRNAQSHLPSVEELL